MILKSLGFRCGDEFFDVGMSLGGLILGEIGEWEVFWGLGIANGF